MMKKLKIAMLGHKRIPGREGGIEVVVEELSTLMAQKGYDVTVYNRHKKGCECPKEFKGVKLIDVPTIERKSTDAAVYSFLASIRILFGKYDVIHYHAIGPSAFLFIPHIFKKKTVVTVHGLNYKTPKWKGFASKFIQFGERITAKYADEIIVLSKEQKKYFKRKYGRDTIYIPNGTVIEKIEEPELIKDKFGLDRDNYLLFVSRVVPGKGLEYLIDAYKDVPGDMPLIIAGGTEYVKEYRNEIIKRADSDSRIRFVGHVEGKVLRELYSNAKLFIFPSEAEGMPMCLLEALSYNCPCLVSDIPENVEVGKEYVLNFKSKNTEDLRDKIADYLDGFLSIKKDSREYIKQYYSWDKVVEETLESYEKL